VRVLVDTSAWVDFLNGYPSREHAAVKALIEGDDDICTCGIVVSEVFQGLKDGRSRDAIEALFRELTFLEPSGIELYLKSASLYRALRRRGKTVRSTIDCLIACLAEASGCYVLARDRDLALILGSGLVEASSWLPGT
jgi:hypothetical protein